MPAHRPRSRDQSVRLGVPLYVVVASCLFVTSASAQVPAAPPAPAPAQEPVTFDAPVGGAATQSPPTPSAATAPQDAATAYARARATTQQLLALEEQAKQLEAERGRVRFVGVRIGKYVSWAAFGVLVTGALSAAGSAASVQEALDDGRTDEAYDTDDDGDVDRADKRHSQRIARAMLGASVLPLATGVFATVLDRMRRRKVSAIDAALTDVRDRRRGLLDRLGVDLGVTRGQAALHLRVRL